MTPREQALMAYFYTVALDPRVRAAVEERSLAQFREAVIACVQEDVPAVLRVALRGAVARVEEPVKRAVSDFTSSLLGRDGGPRAPRAAEGAAKLAGALVEDAFDYVGGLLAGAEKRGREGRGRR